MTVYSAANPGQTTPRHPARRGIRRLAVCCAIGLCLNIAVAWGCAFLVDIQKRATYSGLTEEQVDGVVWLTDVGSAFGSVFIYSERTTVDSDSRVPIGTNGPPSPRETTPHIGGIHKPAENFYSQDHQGWEMRWLGGRGWPMLALWCEYLPAEETVSQKGISLIGVEGGFKTWLPPVVVYYGDAPHVLPYRIVFPGFYVNTLFYTAIAWLGWGGSGVVRRVIRRRRNLCENCGYSRRGGAVEGCPECGWGREPGSRRDTRNNQEKQG